MTCHLFGAKPLHGPKATCSQLDLIGTNFSKILIKTEKIFLFEKYVCKNVVWKILATLFGPQCINSPYLTSNFWLYLIMTILFIGEGEYLTHTLRDVPYIVSILEMVSSPYLPSLLVLTLLTISAYPLTERWQTIRTWASCQIRKIAGAHAPGMPGTFSPSPQVSDPDMHPGTCVTHVPWCMPGSLTSGFRWNRWRGENVPGIPGACATCNFTYLARGPSQFHKIMLTLYTDVFLCLSVPVS